MPRLLTPSTALRSRSYWLADDAVEGGLDAHFRRARRPLPVPVLVPVDDQHEVQVRMVERTQQLLDEPLPLTPALVEELLARQGGGVPVEEVDAALRMWAYATHGSGHRPVALEGRVGTPARLHWRNDLPGGPAPWLDGHGPRDLMMMGMGSMTPYKPGLCTVHLHGAHVHWWADGFPRRQPPANIPALAAPDGTRIVMAPGEDLHAVFPNDQPGAATLWFHDHLFGLTGPNVYAGLVGWYLLRETGELDVAGMPAGEAELPLVLSDRSFAVDVADPANPHLSMLYGDPAQMEFYGTTLLVNGVPKPVHRAEPRWHRLRVVNGSNSRFHHLWAARPHDPRHPWRFTKGSRGVRMVQIGSDGGLLSQAVEVGHARDGRPGVSGVLLAPGERADLLLDLSDVPDGERVVLWTNGPGEPWNPTDFPVDDRREGNTEGLMCFEVSGERTLTAPDLHAIEALHSPTITIRSREQKIALHGLRPEACLPGEETPVDLAELADGLRDWQVQRRRRTEVDDPAGASLPVAGAPLSRRVITLIEPVPGYPSFSLPLHGMAEPLGWDSVLSEQVRQNSVEMWEIVNRTGDTHPIHLHLVQFRVVARFPFDDESMTQSNSVVPAGDYLPPAPGERGWKDVVRCNPDEVTQVVAAFDLPGHYMYHCHILEHEDAGMMRPFIVRPATNG